MMYGFFYIILKKKTASYHCSDKIKTIIFKLSLKKIMHSFISSNEFYFYKAPLGSLTYEALLRIAGNKVC